MTDELDRQLASLKHGDHLCPIYETTAEQIAIAVCFVKEGLARGERCLYIADKTTVAEAARSLAAAGVDVDREQEQGRLQLLNELDVYLRSGQFDPDEMIEYWRRTEAEAVAAGHAGLRVMAAATWAFGPEVGHERLMRYEALLNRLQCKSRTVIVCQYQRSHYDPAVIHDVLRTHPVVVLGEHVCPNPYYEPPELMLAAEPAVSSELTAERVGWWITQLKRARADGQEREQMLAQVQFDRARFEAILRQMPAGVAIFEAPSGRLLMGNDQLAQIWRRSVPEMTRIEHQAKYQGFHPDGQPYQTEEWPVARALLTGEEIVDEEIEILRGDGTRGTVRASASPIRDGDGRVIAGVLTVYDITERKHAEQRLREYAASLKELSRRLVSVQEEERRHLARELHDEVGQLLTSLSFSLAAAGTTVLPEAIQARLDEASALVGVVLTRVRELSYDLRPAMLDHLGLFPALRSLLERFTASTGIRVDFQHADLDQRLAPDVETAAYRIIQEAATNVARHAGVKEAAVRLWLDGDTLKVQIEDRGAGFDPAAALATGLTNGLPGMQERLMLLGGRLHIESAPGSGTHLLAELPLSAHAREETG